MPAAWKTIRVFVSSTFRDMHAERDWLNRFVFPELRSRCLRRGAEFIGVDLRWGVTQQEAEGEGALQICLEEIERCRPFFVCLLGDRFGWIPPPEEVPKAHFENVRHAPDRPADQLRNLEDWYTLDETCDSPVYRLRRDRPIPQEVAGWLARFWERERLPHAGDSITAREILRGVFERGYPQTHALFYLRRPGVWRHDDFPESFVPTFTEVDPHRQRKLTALKEQIQAKSGELVVREYEADYAGLRIDPTFLPPSLSSGGEAALDDGVIRPGEVAGLSLSVRQQVDEHGTIALTGMEELGRQILEDLWLVIERELQSTKTYAERSGDVHQRERAAHERFLAERTRLFLGRQELLERMLTYTGDSSDREPLVVTGPPGSGKSALMAEFARRCRERFPEALVLPHFIGAVAGSTELTKTLRALCEALRRECRLEGEVPADPEELRVVLPVFLEKAAAVCPVILVLDALNQLEPGDSSHELTWLPFHVPAGLRVIVSTLAGTPLEYLRRRTGADHIVEVPILAKVERTKLIQKHLALRRKKLTTEQLENLLDTGDRPDARLPLYLLVALEELCLFGSYEALDERIDKLPPRLPDLFAQVLGRLEHDHTRPLVESVCRWLVAARSGLLESEVLELLRPRRFTSAQWVHLYRALEFYLRPMEEAPGRQKGTGLIGFFHDQLRFAVYQRYLQMSSSDDDPTEAYRASHRELAGYFHCQLNPDDSPPWSSAFPRGLSELPYHQTLGEVWGNLEATLTDLRFVEAKCIAGMTFDLVRDYNAGVAALPETQQEREQKEQRQGSLQQYGVDLIAYTRGEAPLPTPPDTGDLLESIHRSEAASADSCSSSDESRTRYERIQAFARFVSTHSHRLARFPDQICPIAFNHAAKGQVAEQAGRLLDSRTMSWIRRDPRPLAGARPLCLRTLEEHMGRIDDVALTPDGNTAVSASSDNTLRVWDAASGECLRTLVGHTGGVLSVALTPDGNTAVSGSDDGTVRVWDVGSGELLRLLEGHTDEVAAPVALTPDGNTALSGCVDGTVRVWQVARGKLLRTLEGHTDRVSAVALTPDGNTAVAGSEDGTRRLSPLSRSHLMETRPSQGVWTRRFASGTSSAESC